jgi:hypothetical protein
MLFIVFFPTPEFSSGLWFAFSCHISLGSFNIDFSRLAAHDINTLKNIGHLLSRHILPFLFPHNENQIKHFFFSGISHRCCCVPLNASHKMSVCSVIGNVKFHYLVQGSVRYPHCEDIFPFVIK